MSRLRRGLAPYTDVPMLTPPRTKHSVQHGIPVLPCPSNRLQLTGLGSLGNRANKKYMKKHDKTLDLSKNARSRAILRHRLITCDYQLVKPGNGVTRGWRDPQVQGGRGVGDGDTVGRLHMVPRRGSRL